MAQWTIYHNPKCSKSREALALLQARGHNPKVIEYLKEVPTKSEIAGLIDNLQSPLESLVRTKEESYKNLKFDLTSRDQVASYLSQYPELIERPIVVKDTVVWVARPIEVLEKVLEF